MNQTLKTVLIVLGVLAIVFACVGGGLYSYVNGVRGQGKAYETALSGQYRACQLVYSAFTAGFKEKFGVYTATLKGLDTFVSDAVKGRYDSKDAQGNPSGTINAGLYLKAVAEQYPELAGITGLAQNMMDYIQSQRADFKDCQTKTVDMDQNFRLWRTQDLIRSVVVNSLGFPDNDLIAQIGTQKLYGRAAEDKMMELVLTSDALQAYQTGQDVPLLTPAP